MRYNVTDHIAISQPQVKQYCAACQKEIGAFGVILYMNHARYKYYCWMHMDCLNGFHPSIYPSPTKHRISPFGNFNITSNEVGCSVCGKKDVNREPINCNWFLLHKGCLEKLYTSILKVFKKHEMEIVTKAI